MKIEMKPYPKAVNTIGIPGALLLAGAAWLCTHGIQENGWLSVAMTSSSSPRNPNLVGQTIRVDGRSSIRVTAISGNLKADGSVASYLVHADVFCRGKQWFSLRDRAWKHVFLASAGEVHEVLRTEASLPEHAVTRLNSELLLP